MTHILLDIKFKNKMPFLINAEQGKSFIEDWCNFNNYSFMKPPEMISFPPPSEYSGNNSEYNYSGYTGFGILKESHISLHTYPETNFIALDFYSCNQIDGDKNKQFVLDYFKQQHSEIKFRVIKRPYLI